MNRAAGPFADAARAGAQPPAKMMKLAGIRQWREVCGLLGAMGFVMDRDFVVSRRVAADPITGKRVTFNWMKIARAVTEEDLARVPRTDLLDVVILASRSLGLDGTPTYLFCDL